jgi:hypothetical protein
MLEEEKEYGVEQGAERGFISVAQYMFCDP